MIEITNPEPFVQEAEEHVAAGRFEQAAIIYRKLVESFPHEDSYLFRLAWACHDGGRLEEAVACFERLLEKELSQEIFTGFAYDELVRIFKAEGMFERLVPLCEKAVRAQPEDTGYLGDLGEALIKSRRFADARQIFLRMIEIDPTEADFQCRLGISLVMSGNFSGGEEAFEKAAGMDPAMADRFFDKLAHAFCEAGQYERAEAAQRKSIEQRPDAPNYLLNLCEILVLNRKLEEAGEVCEKAIQASPAEAAVYYNRFGNYLLKADFAGKAMEIFGKAAEIDGGNPIYFRRLAECCRCLGLDKDEAHYLQLARRRSNKS